MLELLTTNQYLLHSFDCNTKGPEKGEKDDAQRQCEGEEGQGLWGGEGREVEGGEIF